MTWKRPTAEDWRRFKRNWLFFKVRRLRHWIDEKIVGDYDTSPNALLWRLQCWCIGAVPNPRKARREKEPVR